MVRSHLYIRSRDELTLSFHLPGRPNLWRPIDSTNESAVKLKVGSSNPVPAPRGARRMAQARVECDFVKLREGLVAGAPTVRLEGVMEIDEVYVVAGHKGNPVATPKKAARDGAGASRVRRAAALWKRRNRPSSG